MAFYMSFNQELKPIKPEHGIAATTTIAFTTQIIGFIAGAVLTKRMKRIVTTN